MKREIYKEADGSYPAYADDIHKNRAALFSDWCGAVEVDRDLWLLFLADHQQAFYADWLNNHPDAVLYVLQVTDFPPSIGARYGVDKSAYVSPMGDSVKISNFLGGVK